MDLFSQSYLGGGLASPSMLHGRDCSDGHYLQISQPDSFIPAMLICTIDLYYFIQFSVALSLPECQEVGRKQNLWASFLAHFPTDQN